MKLRLLLSSLLLAFLILGDAEARKSTRRGGSGSGSSAGRRTTPRPRQPQPTPHGSNPSQIGWAVPEGNKHQGSGGVGSKPSAPLPDQNHAQKASAPSLQSGYNPSQSGYNPSVGQQYPNSGQPGGNPYGHQPAGNPYGQYQPSGNPYGQHQPSGNPYGQYNPQQQSYNPNVGQSYNPPVGQPYHQPVGQPYNPPVQPQQVIVVPGQSAQPYKPGLGQLAKEAVVYAGVSAGVNAAVNRILPGGIRGDSGHSSGGGGGNGAGDTHITYNNYYNNQSDGQGGSAPNPANPTDAQGSSTAAPAASAANQPIAPAGNTQVIPLQGAPAPVPNPAPNSPVDPQGTPVANPVIPPVATPPPIVYSVSDEDLQKLTEELYGKDVNNANKHITLNAQGQKTDDSTTDDAPEPLLTVKPEALEIPTVAAVRALYDNYELDTKVKETVTSDERKEETNLLEAFLATDVMTTAMKFLGDKAFIPNDEFEYKDVLRRLWFSQFKRGEEASSSGFENVFLAEQIGSEINGLHNWIYFSDQETSKKANYLGYIKQLSLGSNASIIKFRLSLNGIVKPVTTIFVGTSPELEMALYTVCYFTRPDAVCPVSLGGTKFSIYTNKFYYYGKDILVAAFPEI